MSDEELDALEALVRSASPAPWPPNVGMHHLSSGRGYWSADAPMHHFPGPEDQITPSMKAQNDAHFMSAARDAVPALVAEVRSKSASVACLRQMLRQSEDDLAAAISERDDLKRSAVASQTGDMLKVMFETLLTTSADNPAKNYVACHIEWDGGAFAKLNLPFERIQFALIRPGAQSPTEVAGELRAEVERLKYDLDTRAAKGGEAFDSEIAAIAERDDLRTLLEWLDEQGGLGVGVHNRIRAAIGRKTL